MESQIERLDASVGPEALEARLAALVPALARLLHAAVLDGASINFVLPFTEADAAQWWRTRALPEVAAGQRVLFIARLPETMAEIAGTVQLGLATPPNQPHRADINKLMVHPACRRRGLARALMLAAEAEAVARGRRLLTLDTRTGDAAEPLYTSLGFERAGVIPDYALDITSTHLESATFFYKRVGVW